MDSGKIIEWAFQWEMQFNLDLNKEANEAIFSRKSKIYYYPSLTFNDNDIKNCPHQKHLGIILD